MATATVSNPGVSPLGGDARRWWVLAAILGVEVMDLLDGTIVNVAIPAIRADLHASVSSLQWVTGGYALAFAIGLVTSGRLGDIVGRRRMFLIGVVGFTLTSVSCGLAVSSEMLIGSRLIQGLFAASMIPQGFGLVRQVFPPGEVGKAFAWFGPVIGGSAILGPIVGGTLVDVDLFGLGWRMIFLVNVPIGVASFAIGVRLFPESRAAAPPKLDGIGVALVSLGAGLLMYPLIQGPERGWPLWAIGSLIASALVLGALVVVERSKARRGVSVLVPPSLFRDRAFSAGLGCVFVLFGGVIGLMFVFSVYLQIGCGYRAIDTGLAIGPWALGTAIGAVTGGMVVRKLGRHTLHAGIGLLMTGVALMLAVVPAKGTVSAWSLAGPELIAGAGMGMVISPLFRFVLGGIAGPEVGAGSGVLNAMQQLGAAAGIALVGTRLFATVPARGFGGAFEHCLWIELGLLAACAALVLLLPKAPSEITEP